MVGSKRKGKWRTGHNVARAVRKKGRMLTRPHGDLSRRERRAEGRVLGLGDEGHFKVTRKSRGTGKNLWPASWKAQESLKKKNKEGRERS